MDVEITLRVEGTRHHPVADTRTTVLTRSASGWASPAQRRVAITGSAARVHRTYTALAKLLGTRPVKFPGDYCGFLGQPQDFAEMLRTVLAGEAMRRRHANPRPRLPSNGRGRKAVTIISSCCATVADALFEFIQQLPNSPSRLTQNRYCNNAYLPGCASCAVQLSKNISRH